MAGLHSAVALVLSLLSGMGIGTGGILVLYLTTLGGLSQLEAQGVNLLFYLFAAGAALLVHLSHRRIPTLAVALMILSGIPCALLGAKVALGLPQSLTARLFGLLMIVLGVRGLRLTSAQRPKKARKKQKNEKIFEKSIYK